MPNEEALRFLGLLNRGGKCLIGEPILHNMRKGNALVIAETDSKTALRVKDTKASLALARKWETRKGDL